MASFFLLLRIAEKRREIAATGRDLPFLPPELTQAMKKLERAELSYEVLDYETPGTRPRKFVTAALGDAPPLPPGWWAREVFRTEVGFFSDGARRRVRWKI